MNINVDLFWHQQPQRSDDFLALGNKFFDHLTIGGYAQETIYSYRLHLKYFAGWCHEREIMTPAQVTRSTMELYLQQLTRMKHPHSGNPITAASRKNQHCTLNTFFRWLIQNDQILYNPIEHLDHIKIPRRLPHNTLTAEEMEKLLAQPNIKTPTGLRDRTIMETIYSTGLRRLEITGLHIADVSFSRGTIHVREGKGRKDRLVPLGNRVAYWIQKYLDEARPLLLPRPEYPNLFINKFGCPPSRHTISMMISRNFQAAKIGKEGSCHTLRHTMATLMLENGAEIRYIQELLGHSNISSTEIYTKVSIGKLKEIHNRTHPAKMHPTKSAQILSDLDDILQ